MGGSEPLSPPPLTRGERIAYCIICRFGRLYFIATMADAWYVADRTERDPEVGRPIPWRLAQSLIRKGMLREVGPLDIPGSIGVEYEPIHLDSHPAPVR